MLAIVPGKMPPDARQEYLYIYIYHNKLKPFMLRYTYSRLHGAFFGLGLKSNFLSFCGCHPALQKVGLLTFQKNGHFGGIGSHPKSKTDWFLLLFVVNL